LKEEIEHIKNFCKDIKKTQEENCIMQNEKKCFDKMKNENIKLNADINIIKEDIKEILTNMHNLNKRVILMEEENKNLRVHNKNLVKYIHDTGPSSDFSNRNIHTEGRNFPVENLSQNSHHSPLNQSSIDMAMNIDNNLENHRKRFLIPKTNNNF
jgi:predicted nuclease with TOPRIM domain